MRIGILMTTANLRAPHSLSLSVRRCVSPLILFEIPPGLKIALIDKTGNFLADPLSRISYLPKYEPWVTISLNTVCFAREYIVVSSREHLNPINGSHR